MTAPEGTTGLEHKNGRLITVRSGYGYHTRQPFVSIAVQGDTEALVMVSPAEARDIARSLEGAAAGAEVDEFLIGRCLERVGGGMAQAAGLIHEFRAFRQQEDGERHEDTGDSVPEADG